MPDEAGEGRLRDAVTGPAPSPKRLQKAGVRNPSAKRSSRIATMYARCEVEPCEFRPSA